ATDSVGGTLFNAYDVRDRLIAQTSALGTISYEYDELDRRSRMAVPGQPSVTYGYDASSRLTSVLQAMQVATIDYDAVGRRSKLTLPNQVTTEYQYDADSQLTGLTYRNATALLGDLTYQYDASGNRTKVGGSLAESPLPTEIPSARYDLANRQVEF